MEPLSLFNEQMFAPQLKEFNESHPGFEIYQNIKTVLCKLNGLEKSDIIETLNQIKLALHEISPMKSEPVDCVLWVNNEYVQSNDYNPNAVAPPEMELLKVSILNDGYTQPIVTFIEGEIRTVVDGFHRNRVGKECKEVKDRIHGYLPVVTINSDREDRGDRIAATIRHNRARGKHRIDGMSEIVVELKRRNWSNEKIARELGMDADEILRLSQISGLAEMFANKEFSEAWEVDSINENDNLEIENENETN
jgi:ParB-like chromosome segregation protein Spo0J